MPVGIYIRTAEHNRKIAESNKGQKRTAETKLKMSIAAKKKYASGFTAYWKDKHLPEEYRERISQTCKAKGIEPKVKSVRYGADNNKWKGGVTSETEKIRNSEEYKQWRIAIFRRDDYTCQFCKGRGGKLNADHIKPFALYPELRFLLENGRTLCLDCHKKTPTYLSGTIKLRKQIIVNNT